MVLNFWCYISGPEEDKDFPVEILPHLYLGNAANSEDREALARHRIQYILNVTPDLPNVFESAGSIKYMQIPISDHWSQNLASFFPQAIQFIGKWQLDPEHFYWKWRQRWKLWNRYVFLFLINLTIKKTILKKINRSL